MNSIVKELTKILPNDKTVFPFPTAGGHIIIHELVADYVGMNYKNNITCDVVNDFIRILNGYDNYKLRVIFKCDSDNYEKRYYFKEITSHYSIYPYKRFAHLN